MITKSDVLHSLRPGAQWFLRGDDLEWMDTVQTQPTEAEMTAETKAENEKIRAQAEEEKRELAEQNAARARARVRGGSRMLLSDTRLTPETGIQTLGSNEMKGY